MTLLKRTEEYRVNTEDEAKAAIETFTQIKEDYLNSPEGQEATKYIKQAELLKEYN